MAGCTIQSVVRRLRGFASDEQAVTAAEYAIILALIAVVSMATIGSIGSKFHTLYVTISGAMPEAL